MICTQEEMGKLCLHYREKDSVCGRAFWQGDHCYEESATLAGCWENEKIKVEEKEPMKDTCKLYKFDGEIICEDKRRKTLAKCSLAHFCPGYLEQGEEPELRIFAPAAPKALVKEDQDPDGIKPGEPGAKLDAGKLNASLLGDFSLALKAVAEIATFGANKYSRGGWQHVKDGVERYNDAEWRHKLEQRHEELDADSGLPHKWHHAWNVLAALELELREKLKG